MQFVPVIVVEVSCYCLLKMSFSEEIPLRSKSRCPACNDLQPHPRSQATDPLSIRSARDSPYPSLHGGGRTSSLSHASRWI
jgi:hypothetical protein